MNITLTHASFDTALGIANKSFWLTPFLVLARGRLQTEDKAYPPKEGWAFETIKVST